MFSMSTNEYPPTPEQTVAIDTFVTGENMVIEAGAGTGKTSTLVFLAENGHARGLRGQYLAFNKAIVVESKDRFPASCDARTIHSLAIRSLRPALRNRLNSRRLPRSTEARILDVDDLNVVVGIGDAKQNKRLRAEVLVAYVMQGVERFCQSDSPEIEPWHFPTIEGIDAIDENGSHRGTNNRRIARDMVAPMTRAWADLTSDTGRLRFQHSTYLKMYELSGPTIGVDYILFDEAQDVSGVMRSIVLQQIGKSQLVFVGDSQQEIYGFTGATNAMAQLEGPRCYLTQSFRFGPAVAEVANRILDRIEGAALRLRGFDKIESHVARVEAPDAVLCRTNAKAVQTALSAMAEGKRVSIADSLKRAVIWFAEAAEELKVHGSTDHPELAPFISWEAVQAFVSEDPAGGDLKLLVDLVDEFGTEIILTKLAQTVSPRDADLTVSTAHTSKGLEWGAVRLADDFTRESKDGKLMEPSVEDLRLLYVAVTRAKFVLDCYSVPMTLAGPTHSNVPAEAPALPAAPTVEVDPDVIDVDPVLVDEVIAAAIETDPSVADHPGLVEAATIVAAAFAPALAPAPTSIVDPAEAALWAAVDAGYFADEDDAYDAPAPVETGRGTAKVWADVIVGDTVEHPTYGTVRIRTIRVRDTRRTMTAKRVGESGEVLFSELAEDQVLVVNETAAAV